MQSISGVVTDGVYSSFPAHSAEFNEGAILQSDRTESDIDRRPKRMAPWRAAYILIVGFGSPPIVNQTHRYTFVVEFLHDFDGFEGVGPGSFCGVNQLVRLVCSVGASKHILAIGIGADQLLTPS